MKEDDLFFNNDKEQEFWQNAVCASLHRRYMTDEDAVARADRLVMARRARVRPYGADITNVNEAARGFLGGKDV